jgi:hypothetical protein
MWPFKPKKRFILMNIHTGLYFWPTPDNFPFWTTNKKIAMRFSKKEAKDIKHSMLIYGRSLIILEAI